MRKIAVLDLNTIDKIAAGEVVERPSSVVKELVENAIDAGATAVTVEITDGGKKLIRITDNGSGMEAEQIPLAFLRHATSKIEKVEDLEHIASLGFRGEALSSIAAVSQVELITKTPSSVSGSRYVIEGGQEHSLEELGAPEGTTFLVRNLFYNTPARSKFLKSDTTEANYIHTLMEQLALSHPEISFKYIQNKQVKLHTSGNYSVKDVIYSVYGREIARALLEVSQENSFMKIEGFVGKPEIARGNRSFENYYINGRYVKNNIITKAIENAYRGFLMQHKFPFVSLRMEMEGNDLDVNVHPAKREVRFAREQEVYDAVYDTVRAALTRREMIPKVSVDSSSVKEDKEEKVTRAAVPEPFEQKRREELYGAQKPVHSVVREPAASYRPAFSKDEEEMFSGTLRENQKLDEVKKLAATPCDIPVLKAASLFACLTGIRISDILDLQWEDFTIAPDQGYCLRIRTQKTQTEATLPISYEAYELCGTPGTGKVFKDLKRSMINYPLKSWLKKAGITKPITFHGFRHSYAVIQISLGTDIYTVSKMLTHKNVSTTQIYADLVNSKKRETANKISLK